MVLPILSALVKMLKDEEEEEDKKRSTRYYLSKIIALIITAFIGLIGIGIMDFLMLRLL